MRGRGSGTGRRRPYLVQAVAALAWARATFLLIDDPEGPNAVVVAGLAIVLCAVSVPVFRSRLYPTLVGERRAFAMVPLQGLAAAILLLVMR